MADYVNKVLFNNEVVLDLTADTAEAGKVLSGYTFHDKSGASATGTMPNNTATATEITLKDETVTIPQGYHDGTGTVAIDSDEQDKIIAENIKNGVSILGVLGTFDFPSDAKIAIAQNGVRASKTVTSSTSSGSSSISNTVSIDISADDIEVIACFYATAVKREQNTTTTSSTPWYNNTVVYPLESTVAATKTTSYTKTFPSEGTTRVSRTVSQYYQWTKPSTTQYLKFKGTHTMILIYREITAEE